MHGENNVKILVWKYNVKDHLEDLEVDWRIILRYIVRKEDGRLGSSGGFV
jgi:hypothetical protein